MSIWETLAGYFSFPFVRSALIAGVLIALCAGLLGVTLVLKRFSFIGDGLSHVAFGAMAVATVLSPTNNLLIIMPITVLAAVLLLRTGQDASIRGDAALAMISVGSLAVGYLIMNVFSTSANVAGDIDSTLFGSTSILTLSTADVWTCVIMSAVVITVFTLFYHKIFAVTFDERFAEATGVRAGAMNTMIAVVTAVIIVLAMKLVGALLVSALIVFPSLSAMRVFRSFKSVVLCSALVSVGCAAAGILLSILTSTPVGATVVAVDMLVFFVFCIIGRVVHAD